MGTARFILGRAGSGKSRHCLDSIIEAVRADPLGPPILWLLPRQSTFTAERQLTCESGLGGYCRVQVLSFDRLAQDILAECGGCAIPELTPLGRRMILGHLLRRHEAQLQYFRQVARHAGTAERLDATLAEFERCGKDPAALAQLLAEMPDGPADGDAASLRAKVHDLHLLFTAYSEFIGQDRLDPAQRVARVLACIERSEKLRGAAVFVDGFADFEQLQMRMLARMAHVCASVDIALLIDPKSQALRRPADVPDDLGLFFRTERTYRRLLRVFEDEGVALQSPLVLQASHRFASAALGEIERSMFEFRAGPADAPPDGIELLEAPDRRAEVDAAARRIRRLMAEGLRLREITVLVRQVEPYHDLIDASFREHGIRFFIDRRRTMAHHPLLQFLRAVLAIAQERWPHEAVMSLLKCGLAGVSADEADALENYVLLHRIRDAAWTAAEPWTYCRRPVDREEPDDPTHQAEYQRMDKVRRDLVEKLAPFTRQFDAAAALPVRQIAAAIFDVFDSFGVPATLARWIDAAHAAGQHEQAGEHEQIWSQLLELMDQLVDLLGDEVMPLADFRDVLQSALDGFSLALAPPTVDEVLIGQIDRTRANENHVVLLLGMNEGVFPCAPSEATILSDLERQELGRRQFDLDPGTERRLLDENLLGYIAFTRASQRLYVSRCLADDAARPLGPSPFWRRLCELFPLLQPQILPRDPRAQPAMIGTPRQLLTALMRWVRDGGNVEPSQPWPALYQWLAHHPTDAVGAMGRLAWKALGYNNGAALSPKTAQQLFASPLSASVSQVEAFAACPFRHYLSCGLGLQSREDQDPTGADLSGIYHSILQRIGRQLLRQRLDWDGLSAARQKELLELYCRQVGQNLRGELMLSSARNRYILDRIERTAGQVVDSQRIVAQHNRFRTAHVDVAFGDDASGQLPPLVIATPAGGELQLRGRIDRVDVLEQQAAFAVIDYRLRHDRLALDEVYHGLSLQLLVYLLVLEANGSSLAGQKLTPAGAFCVRLLTQLESVRHPDDAADPADPEFPLLGPMRGIFDGRFAGDFDQEATEKFRVISAQRKKDGTFGYKHQTDVADARELAALMAHVRQVLAKLADQILSGCIAVNPYRKGQVTPCPRCGYKSICRFDSLLNGYRFIDKMNRQEVLETVCQEASHG